MGSNGTLVGPAWPDIAALGIKPSMVGPLSMKAQIYETRNRN